MRTLFARLTLLLVACLFACGCKPSVAVPVATPAPASVEAKPASEAECKEFAKSVEKAVREKDRASLERLLSLEDLAERCVSDISLPADQKAGLLKGVKKGAKQNTFVTQILGEIDRGGRYKLLRVHEVDGRTRCMFRLISEENGVIYHDMVPASYPDGRVGIEDIYLFAAGEMISQSIRRLLLPAVAELNRSLVADLRGDEKVYMKNLSKIQQMVRSTQAGQYAEAIAIYKSLPTELREQKMLIIAYIAACKQNEEYSIAIETYRRLFPNDPAVDFHSIDYFLLKKQYDEALKCIDKTDKAVGGDPYLHTLRANTLLEATRCKEAAAAAEKAIELEPDLPDGYWSRLSVALKEKNHADTLSWLKKAVEHAGQVIGDLTKIADYADFVKSPKHQEWVNWYAMRKKG